MFTFSYTRDRIIFHYYHCYSYPSHVNSKNSSHKILTWYKDVTLNMNKAPEKQLPSQHSRWQKFFTLSAINARNLAKKSL